MTDLDEKLEQHLTNFENCDQCFINIFETDDLTVTFLSVDEGDWYVGQWNFGYMYNDGFEYVGNFDHCHMFKHTLRIPLPPVKQIIDTPVI